MIFRAQRGWALHCHILCPNSSWWQGLPGTPTWNLVRNPTYPNTLSCRAFPQELRQHRLLIKELRENSGKFRRHKPYFQRNTSGLGIDEQIDFSFVEEAESFLLPHVFWLYAVRPACCRQVWATCQIVRGSKSIRKPGDHEWERLPNIRTVILFLLLNSWFPYRKAVAKFNFDYPLKTARSLPS